VGVWVCLLPTAHHPLSTLVVCFALGLEKEGMGRGKRKQGGIRYQLIKMRFRDNVANSSASVDATFAFILF